MGKEPSNYTFNSVIELEQEGGKPRNPFVNAGALVTTDAMLDAPDAGGGLDELMDFVRTAAGDDRISIDEQVAASEYRTAYRNFSGVLSTLVRQSAPNANGCCRFTVANARSR